jgi:hypothetical protein
VKSSKRIIATTEDVESAIRVRDEMAETLRHLGVAGEWVAGYEHRANAYYVYVRKSGPSVDNWDRRDED